MSLYSKLVERERDGSFVRVGVVGAGQMGLGMIVQISKIPGMRVTGICDVFDKNVQNARDAYLVNSSVSHDIYTANSYTDMIGNADIDVVVDATGVPEVGAGIALDTLTAKKHLILLNVEADVTVGPFLNALYQSSGLVFSGSAGDEPAAAMELFEFAKSLGLKVLVAGKGKNNHFIPESNPDMCADEANRKRMSAHMLASFQDGTKTMAEMNLLSNATGLIPDKTGMHGVQADVKTVVQKLDLQENGGVLSQYGVVEYVHGLAPGVFVIATSKLSHVQDELRYLKVGDGPNYVLYRPYHLASLETPLSAARAVLLHEPTIVAAGAPVSETVAVVKRDIKAGENIDGIGGYCVRGVTEIHSQARTNGHVPIGLIAGITVAKRDISKGTYLTYDDLEMDQSTQVWHLRQLQERHFSA